MKYKLWKQIGEAIWVLELKKLEQAKKDKSVLQYKWTKDVPGQFQTDHEK
jgi:hypothetical protein